MGVNWRPGWGLHSSASSGCSWPRSAVLALPRTQQSPELIGLGLQCPDEVLLGLQLLLHLAQLQGGRLEVAAAVSSFCPGSSHLEGGKKPTFPTRYTTEHPGHSSAQAPASKPHQSHARPTAPRSPSSLENKGACPSAQHVGSASRAGATARRIYRSVQDSLSLNSFHILPAYLHASS